MAAAACENCGKDWTLRKHPDDYAGNGPSCPDCGSTRVTVRGGEDAGGEITPQQAPRQQGQPPARQDEGLDTFESVMAVADEEMPAAARAEGAKNLLEHAGGILQRFVAYQQQRREAKERRAENATLEKAVDLPECEGCGYQFSGEDIPLSAERVRCPECNAVYDIQDAQPPA